MAVAGLFLLPVGVFAGSVGYLWMNEVPLLYVGAVASDSVELPRLAGVVREPWDTTRLTTSDSVEILALEILRRPDSDHPWVIHFYGAGQRLANASSLALYEVFDSVGLNVLAVEYRGYGGSEQVPPSERGLYADGRAAWDHLTGARGVAPERIILYGFSLGTGVATQLATEVEAAALVTAGTYTSMSSPAKVRYPWIPMAILELLMRSDFSNLEKALQVTEPWLLLHGRHDSAVLLQDSEALAATTGGPRTLVVFEAGHGDIPTVAKNEMIDALEAFVRDAIPDHSRDPDDIGLGGSNEQEVAVDAAGSGGWWRSMPGFSATSRRRPLSGRPIDQPFRSFVAGF